MKPSKKEIADMRKRCKEMDKLMDDVRKKITKKVCKQKYVPLLSLEPEKLMKLWTTKNYLYLDLPLKTIKDFAKTRMRIDQLLGQSRYLGIEIIPAVIIRRTRKKGAYNWEKWREKVGL